MLVPPLIAPDRLLDRVTLRLEARGKSLPEEVDLLLGQLSLLSRPWLPGCLPRVLSALAATGHVVRRGTGRRACGRASKHSQYQCCGTRIGHFPTFDDQGARARSVVNYGL
jgi:hypothetical protein